MTSGSYRRSWLRNLGFLVGLCTVGVLGNASHAQFGLVRGVVGGVSIDAEGVVQSATQAQKDASLAELRQAVAGAQGAVAKPQAMRMISLRKLQEAIMEHRSADKTLPEEILFLAGLQRIEYVFVYPQENDIVIAGPAEGWEVRGDGSVVGTKSSRPVVRVEDLMTAFRTVEAARQAPISVSIDPTPEGSQRLNNLLRGMVANGPSFQPQIVEAAVRQAFGPQQVTFTTVATDTRMAQTLVAADYRMKLLAMSLEASPVDGLPSYLEMTRNVQMNKGSQPRWWIACQYDAIRHSEDGLSWKLDGRGVKAMTEEELVGKDGTRSAAKKTNQFAQKWADLFTSKFDELSMHNASFGELRNAIDMNVVATLIAAQQLDKSAGLDLSVLRGTKGDIETSGRLTPKTIPAHCSLLKARSGWVVAASGGVEINPWQIVAQSRQADATLVSKRAPAINSANTQWWWD
ncbi:MAG: DUF1598 domain-containing protein [Pirellulaceae bacterium]|nr:DUF1598 domain-containing protein [Pirellulaceae bacterium]